MVLMNSDDSNGAASEASSGVYRVEADGETGVPYATLTEATSEPPMDPEAQVYGRGGCLAQASHERAVWLYTGLGAELLRLEHDVRRCA